jgi:hypothetical protein
MTKTASTAKVLNMEEKKKFEKIIHADIDRAVAEYRTMRSEKSSKMCEDHANDKRAQALLKEYNATLGVLEDLRKEFDKLYLEVKGDESGSVRVEVKTYGYYGQSGKWPVAEKFFAETEKQTQAIQELKRTYTLKLFAGGEEVENLFADLQNTLKSIISK